MSGANDRESMKAARWLRLGVTVDDQMKLAGGIYVALLTTLEGLLVAIPATACFAYLRNRLVRSTIEVGAIVEDLFERFRPQS